MSARTTGDEAAAAALLLAATALAPLSRLRPLRPAASRRGVPREGGGGEGRGARPAPQCSRGAPAEAPTQDAEAGADLPADPGEREPRGPGGAVSRELPFVKMHGAGNDFVVLDGLRGELPPLERLARLDRRPPLRRRLRPAPRRAPLARGRLPHGDLQRRRLPGGDVRQRPPRLLQVPARPRAHERRRGARRDARRHPGAPRRAGRTACASRWAARCSRPPRSRRGSGAATGRCSTSPLEVDGRARRR